MTRRTLVILTAIVAVAAFAAAGWLHGQNDAEQRAATPLPENSQLVRSHAAVFGPLKAPVTIVEFFDPACETCRAFYPVVKKIMGEFPNEVRLVMRHAPFHQGSDEVVRLLEAARLQRLYEPVLEAVLVQQQVWASHSAPRLEKVWDVAAAAGLDVEKARAAIMKPEITAVLEQDMADLKVVGVKATPTFFVNGKPLPSFGAQQLYDLVLGEVQSARAAAGKS